MVKRKQTAPRERKGSSGRYAQKVLHMRSVPSSVRTFEEIGDAPLRAMVHEVLAKKGIPSNLASSIVEFASPRDTPKIVEKRIELAEKEKDKALKEWLNLPKPRERATMQEAEEYHNRYMKLSGDFMRASKKYNRLLATSI